ncbi:unnamed protein product [Moneuplotes crassus]|uniref:Uncharacterized protein n=1 Tax=Euplotes crassus TaxID=5936 RepID=A0AAD1Y8U7_EUPCR|nr:unnamed protein product [Moneuplotes crassus]
MESLTATKNLLLKFSNNINILQFYGNYQQCEMLMNSISKTTCNLWSDYSNEYKSSFFIWDGRRKVQISNFDQSCLELLQKSPDCLKQLDLAIQMQFAEDVTILKDLLDLNPKISLISTKFQNVYEKELLLKTLIDHKLNFRVVTNCKSYEENLESFHEDSSGYINVLLEINLGTYQNLSSTDPGMKPSSSTEKINTYTINRQCWDDEYQHVADQMVKGTKTSTSDYILESLIERGALSLTVKEKSELKISNITQEMYDNEFYSSISSFREFDDASNLILESKYPFNWRLWKSFVFFLKGIAVDADKTDMSSPGCMNIRPRKLVSYYPNKFHCQSLAELKNVHILTIFEEEEYLLYAKKLHIGIHNSSKLLYYDDTCSVFVDRAEEKKQTGLMKTFKITKARLVKNPQHHPFRREMISHLKEKGFEEDMLKNCIIIRNNMYSYIETSDFKHFNPSFCETVKIMKKFTPDIDEEEEKEFSAFVSKTTSDKTWKGLISKNVLIDLEFFSLKAKIYDYEYRNDSLQQLLCRPNLRVLTLRGFKDGENLMLNDYFKELILEVIKNSTLDQLKSDTYNSYYNGIKCEEESPNKALIYGICEECESYKMLSSSYVHYIY